MSRFSHWSAILALAACLTPAAAGETDPSVRPSTLRLEAQFILEAVARRMNVTLRPEIPVPVVFFESTTPLRQFQDAIEAQWQFRPHVFCNAYSVARNEIYLTDDDGYYARTRRTLDDSLAHEFAHYLQARYQNADLADSWIETEAVQVQQAFRQDHLYPRRAQAGF